MLVCVYIYVCVYMRAWVDVCDSVGVSAVYIRAYVCVYACVCVCVCD
jgi:hypothetical protein